MTKVKSPLIQNILPGHAECRSQPPSSGDQDIDLARLDFLESSQSDFRSLSNLLLRKRASHSLATNIRAEPFQLR